MSLRVNKDLLKDAAFVGGAWVQAKSGESFIVENPADQTVLGSVPDMDAGDAAKAVDAAQNAFADWSGRLPVERGRILSAWARLIEEHAGDIALIMTLEQGKPLKEARGEVLASAATIQWCAEEGRRLYGDFQDGPGAGTKIIVSRHPVGVVGAITPWNFPSSMITRKVGPALAAGCSVVLKPAEATPLTALALVALAEKVGFPAGVLNIVTSTRSSEIGKVFTADPRVAKISFTGSTRVGKLLMAQAAEHVQKVSLELGGNAPFLVFPSCDLDRAVEAVIASKFRNAGQTCICANRIFVHQDIAEDFAGLFQARVQSLKVGNGWEDGVEIGPLINNQAIEKVERMVSAARDGNARVLTGGARHGAGDQFYQPTLITGVADDNALFREEIFGPVAVLYPFADEAEAIRRANDTSYGLAAYLYSNDHAQVWRVSDALQYGMVGVNEPLLASDLAPFGGIKESGIGREGGKYGLLEYTNLKYRLMGQ